MATLRDTGSPPVKFAELNGKNGPTASREPESGYARSTSDFLRSNPEFRCPT